MSTPEGFEFHNMIGRGASSAVWAATQLSTGRAVALKMLNVDMQDKARSAPCCQRSFQGCTWWRRGTTTRCDRSTATGRRRYAGPRSDCCYDPNIDMDGDLLGATLPRRAPVQMTVGRGYLVTNGEPRIVQSARWWVRCYRRIRSRASLKQLREQLQKIAQNIMSAGAEAEGLLQRIITVRLAAGEPKGRRRPAA